MKICIEGQNIQATVIVVAIKDKSKTHLISENKLSYQWYYHDINFNFFNIK